MGDPIETPFRKCRRNRSVNAIGSIPRASHRLSSSPALWSKRWWLCALGQVNFLSDMGLDRPWTEGRRNRKVVMVGYGKIRGWGEIKSFNLNSTPSKVLSYCSVIS